MALSNGKYNNGPLIFLSPRSQKTIDGKVEDVDPHFEISRVGEDGKIAKTAETAKEVFGDLIRIEFKEREFKDKQTKHAVLYIRDGKETYHLDLTYRISTRSLFNAFLSLEDAKNLKISYYLSKKGFESFAVRQGDELVKWKYELKDLPVAEVIKDKKGVVIKTDYSDVDQFFENKLIELSEKLFGRVEEKKSDVKSEVSNKEAPVAGDKKDEDVPF